MMRSMAGTSKVDWSRNNKVDLDLVHLAAYGGGVQGRLPMRRKEFEVTDPQELGAVLNSIEWGTLALITPQGTPLQVPLNFVHLDGHLYFHGSPAGEKIATLKQNAAASFLVVDPHA